jgi:phosphinothricin acetyltransferase
VVAEEAGEVLGWGSLQPYKPRAGYRFTAENSVYVAETARGKGVGKVILKTLIEEVERLPIRSVIAGVSGDNEASLHLHRTLGFTEAGTLEAAVYKFGLWIDVVYLRYEVPGWETRCR